MTQTSNQKELIHEHLKNKGPLTVLTALKEIGCMALSQIVSEMRREGVPVKDEWITTNTGKNIKQYYL
jgi:hypothetical protein